MSTKLYAFRRIYWDGDGQISAALAEVLKHLDTDRDYGTVDDWEVHSFTTDRDGLIVLLVTTIRRAGEDAS